ncbi:MAG: FAD-dependent oxidoreductase [Anaerolineales bacterium]|nr:NAD(P)/FAD-dependent oxidoreductase [Anaerolineae bacterium]PWB70998.1 MAG: FAD-dependent oxidoreductase [Anaerolineales bacterium]
MNAKQLPHVVIIGAGFGGLTAAQKLKNAPIRITLIDKNNYHLFQPLLYQVAIAGLLPSQIAYPLRTIFRKQENLTFQMGEVSSIDFASRFVKLNGSVIAYDYLILAVGGETNFFGMDGVKESALQLKDIDSAVNTRNHLLRMFEKASREADAEKRKALLTFVVVGGGPTGVETAGALAELISHVMRKEYPTIDPAETRVLLLEAGNALIASYPDELRRATHRLLSKKNVEIQYNARLTDFNGQRVRLADGTQIMTHTLIWTAGVKAAEITNQLGVRQAGSGRVRVAESLQMPDHPEVYVIGDAAYLENGNGQPLPMLSTVAIQQGNAVAENIRRAVNGQTQKPFHYKDPGLLATIGRNAAVARLWGISFSGLIAWLIWVGLHIYRLIGFRNRLVVLINWAWDYFFYDNQVRLITRE